MKKHIRYIIGALIVIGAMALVGVYEYNQVWHTAVVEAGVDVSANDFLKKADASGYFTIDSDSIINDIPGEYQLYLRSGWITHKCKLLIRDTIAPKGKAKRVCLELGQVCAPDKFVSDVEDATDVTVTYIEKPDFSKGGKHDVVVLLTDSGGNTTTITSELLISQVVEEINVEVKSEPPAIDKFVIEGQQANFISDINKYDFSKVADHDVVLKVDGIVYHSKLHVVDTIPPEVKVHDLTRFAQYPLEPEEFVDSVNDATNVTVSWKKMPDINQVGEQEVEISFVDEGKNEVIKKAKLNLALDTEKPIINGASDMSTIVGKSVSYKKNISVTDNSNIEIPLEVDSSKVNINKTGTYPVTYTARDLAGNVSTVTVNLTVKPKEYSEAEINAIADGILVKIINDGMTPLEKTRAIFNYITKHISYISHSEKGNYLRAAYEGLVDGKGDCYVYACTSKVLLTRAGISTIDISKIPAETSHYWNLVNLGEGWYHFDTTPRKDHPVIFMWSDAQMMDYSARHKDSHNYDHSLYPIVN